MSAVLAPVSPHSLDPATLTVRLSGASGQPLTRAQVVADPQMPGMDMGEHPVTLHPQSNGVYQASLRFTMPGAWNVTVIAARDGKQGVTVLPVTVR